MSKVEDGRKSRLSFQLPKSLLSHIGRTNECTQTFIHLGYDPSGCRILFPLLEAAKEQPQLWGNKGFEHDVVDVTRQVFANAFLAVYVQFVGEWDASTSSPAGNTTRRDKRGGGKAKRQCQTQ